MARQKRWTIPFMSMAGVSCRIDIYDEGWTGAVTELSQSNANAPGLPAADPFYYEEDDDSDLLKVVRYKTGYINLIETTYNGLIDLYPETNTEHYVEFYYGLRLDFTGYIQAQAFDNSFTAEPREVSLPVMSPMGLLEGINFDAINPPETITLGEALKMVIDKMNAAYTKIIYPLGGASGSSAVNLYDEINSLIISPWNGSFNKHNGTTADLFAPKSLKYYMEALCNAYGWMVHDTPDALVFTDWNYKYPYRECPVADLDDMSGETTYTGVEGGDEIEVADCFDFCDDDAGESVVMPIHVITKKFEGSTLDTINFPFDRMRLETIDDTYTYKTAELAPVGPEVSGMVVPGYVDSNGKTQSGVSPCIIGSLSEATEGLTFTCPNGGYSAGTTMFVWNIYEHPEGDCRLVGNMSWGDNVNQLDNQQHTFYFRWDAVCGSWHDGGQVMVSQDGNGFISLLDDVPRRGVLTITFSHVAGNGMIPGMVYCFNDLSLKRNPDQFHEYVTDSSTERKITGNNASSQEESIEMPMSYELDNSGLIGDDVYTGLQNYNYLLQSQNRLQAKFLEKALPDNLYIPLWEYWVTGWHWRMIAVAFHPWDDMYQLTLHRSSTI